jgi:hypothetical protein
VRQQLQRRSQLGLLIMDDEMEALNLDDLDVETLEQRLELAPVGGGCPMNQGCEPLCENDISWRC